MPTHLVAHLYFFATAQSISKKSKRATKQPHQRQRKWTDEPRKKKNNEGITAPTQKAGFRVPKTHLWLMEV